MSELLQCAVWFAAGFVFCYVIVSILFVIQQVNFYRRYGVSKRQYDADFARLRRMMFEATKVGKEKDDEDFTRRP